MAEVRAPIRAEVLAILAQYIGRPEQARVCQEKIEELYATHPETATTPGSWAIEKAGLLRIIGRQGEVIAQLTATSQGDGQ